MSSECELGQRYYHIRLYRPAARGGRHSNVQMSVICSSWVALATPVSFSATGTYSAASLT